MGTKDSKPNNKQPTSQGGMVPQRPKPPIESQADTSGKSDPGSYMRGVTPTPRGGSGSASNKKPTP